MPKAIRPSDRRTSKRVALSVGIPQDFTLEMQTVREVARSKSQQINGISESNSADVQDLPSDYAARPRSWLMFGFYSLSRVLAGLHGEDQFFDRIWAARQLLFHAIEARNREIVSRFDSSNPPV